MDGVYSLRPLKAKDAERMLQWMQNDNVTEFLQIGGRNVKLESVQGFIEGAADESVNLHRAIVDDNDVYFGTVSLKHIDLVNKEAEYAIAMHMEGIGTGAARQGSNLLFQIAKEKLALKRLYLYVKKVNQRAVKFYSKGPWVPCKPLNDDESLLWFEIPLDDLDF